jgi:HSP20 family protein
MSLARKNNIWDKWMEDVFRGELNPFSAANWKTADMPAVNIKENKHAYTVEAAVPGFNKDEIQVKIENGMLSIRGEKKSEQEHKADDSEKTTRKEFSYSMFSRSFSLPADVNEQGIQASHENGVLKIELPRVQEPQAEDTARKIEIK